MLQHVLACVLVASVMVGQTVPQPGKPAVPAPRWKPVTVALTKVTYKKDELRPGFGLTLKAPLVGWKLALKSQTWLVFDLDGDGKLTPGKDDGLGIVGSPFIVPLPASLWCEAGVCDLAFDGVAKATLTPRDPGAGASLVADGSNLNALRVQSGLKPFTLDATACRACEKHCEYLRRNNLFGNAKPMSPHDEDPALPGYTPEGAAAGMHSDIGTVESIREEVEGLYATVWHRVPFLQPAQTRIGLGSGNYIQLVYFVDEVKPPDAPLPHPADGQRDIPIAFTWAGEWPDPTPATHSFGHGFGFPILVMLPEKDLKRTVDAFTVTEVKGRPIEGLVSCPAAPANPEWASNSGSAVFLPKAPLKPLTKYTAELRLSGLPPLTWTFTTGKA